VSACLDEVVSQVTAWDDARQRSQQTAIGWSQVAGCRRYMGYRMAGEWATDDTDNWRAIAGTALHGWLGEVRRASIKAADEHAEFEPEVSYQGIPGHVDEVNFTRGEVTDYKFPSKASAELWHDPKVLAEKMIQPHGYGAALLGRLGGDPSKVTVRLLVAPVDGTFADWWVHEEPLDLSVADAAVERYLEAEAMYQAGQELPRDKPLWWCSRFCEFATLCRPGLDGEREEDDLPAVDDEELAAAVERYGLAREQASEADAVKKQVGPLIRGLRGTARGWKITTSAPGYDWKPDKDQIEADYAASGLEVPMRRYPKMGALNVTRVKQD
jgi:hypothetical protein